jgi:hypothetical protein
VPLFVPGFHGRIDPLRTRFGFQPKARRHFPPFSGVDRGRLDSSPMSSYCYLVYGVRFERFTAAANRGVYKANAPEFRSLGGIAMTTAVRCKARNRIRGIK